MRVRQARLRLDQSQSFTGSVAGLSLVNKLDLSDIAFGASTTATYNSINGILTVTDGTHTSHITLLGDFSKSTFTTSSDGHGGTYVVDPLLIASESSKSSVLAVHVEAVSVDPGASTLGESNASTNGNIEAPEINSTDINKLVGRGGIDHASSGPADNHSVSPSESSSFANLDGGFNFGQRFIDGGHENHCAIGTNTAVTIVGSATGAGEQTEGLTGVINLFEGLDGDDTVTGSTRVIYFSETAGVTITIGALGTRSAHGTAAGDTATVGNDIFTGGVNSAIGFNFADTIIGSNANEKLEGSGGNDTLSGGGGLDTPFAGASKETLFCLGLNSGSDGCRLCRERRCSRRYAGVPWFWGGHRRCPSHFLIVRTVAGAFRSRWTR